MLSAIDSTYGNPGCRIYWHNIGSLFADAILAWRVGKFMMYLPVTVFSVLRRLFALIFAPTLGISLAKIGAKKQLAMINRPSQYSVIFTPLLNKYLKLLRLAIAPLATAGYPHYWLGYFMATQNLVQV